ncbi:Tudor domain-containing protein 3, partial [Pseudolycoriella hygida]
MLLLELTDGSTLCSAIELDHLPALSVNTPPGTKLLLKGTIKIFQGMLVLTPSSIKNCNGVVTAMVEKWEYEKAMSKYAKGVQPSGDCGSVPPPWIPFGQKIQQTIVNDGTFKSLSVEKKNDETKEKDVEFLNNRNDIIAELLKTKQKKIFGGGKRQLLDHNVKKIMEKGYTEEQAKTTLKFARNNLEKAMGNLKRREDRSSGETSSTRVPFNKGQKEDRFGRKGRVEETEGAKPSNKVSLFDFLEDKIKIPKGTETTPVYSTTTVTANKPSAKNVPSDEPYPKKNYRSEEYQPSNRTSNRNIQSINGTNPQSQSQSQIDNRSKFENNISTSFANRQKKEDDQHQNARTYNDSKTGKWSGKPNSVNQRQNSQESSSGSYPKATRSHTSNYSQNSYQNTAPNSAYGQKYVKNFNETSKPSRFDEKQHHQQHARNEQIDRRNNAPYNVNQLAEATASMKLSNNKRQSYNSQHNYPSKHQQSQSQPSTRQQSQNHQGKNAAPMPNGFEYNPYKIMGFQNKETNEFALNVLKNQNFDAVPPTVLGKPTQPMSSEGYAPMPSNRNFTVPPPSTAPATVMATQPFMPLAVNNQPYNWTWKEHDICFAKYWEDGRYYNAEITAVSNKTCVVQFMEYGNFEEVFLNDCLPFNEATIQSVNQYNNSLIPDQNVQYY